MLKKFFLKRKLKYIKNNRDSKYIFGYKNLFMIIWKDRDIFHNETFFPALYYTTNYSEEFRVTESNSYNRGTILQNAKTRITMNNLCEIKDKQLIIDSNEIVEKIIDFLKEENC